MTPMMEKRMRARKFDCIVVASTLGDGRLMKIFVKEGLAVWSFVYQSSVFFEVGSINGFVNRLVLRPSIL